jgi:hypothetical protein
VGLISLSVRSSAALSLGENWSRPGFGIELLVAQGREA